MLKPLPSNAGGTVLILSWESNIWYALGPKNQNMKQKKCPNKFNDDFKKWVWLKKKKNFKKSSGFQYSNTEQEEFDS